MDGCELTSHGQEQHRARILQGRANDRQISLLHLPVGVNCQAGDPFQPDQEANTLAKLKALEDSCQQGAVGLLTKCAVSESTLLALARIDLDLFLFFTVTGLRESPIHTIERVLASYLAACRILPTHRVAIVIRPIIPGMNDDLSIVSPILDVAQQGQGLLVARGFRAPSWQLISNQGFMAILARECDLRGLRAFHHTACLVASVHQTACKLHGGIVDETGLSLAVALGYDAYLRVDSTTNQPVIVLPPVESLSMGDVHLVQLLTGVRVLCDGPEPTNVLGLLKAPDGTPLDCSSSWFTYANNTPCQIGCPYCEANYRPHPWGEVGCCPANLITLLASNDKAMV